MARSIYLQPQLDRDGFSRKAADTLPALSEMQPLPLQSPSGGHDGVSCIRIPLLLYVAAYGRSAGVCFLSLRKPDKNSLTSTSNWGNYTYKLPGLSIERVCKR